MRSLRLRLAAWYLAFFSLLLVLFSIYLYGVLARALESRLDDTLATEAATAAGLLTERAIRCTLPPDSRVRSISSSNHPSGRT